MGQRIPGTWNEDGEVFKADDGRRFVIFSELVRGEGRFYWVLEDVSGDEWPSFVAVPFDGAHDKRTVRRRVHRHVRETASVASE
jgi:hypothetical protein